jgi:hypothetical protein
MLTVNRAGRRIAEDSDADVLTHGEGTPRLILDTADIDVHTDVL